MITRFAPEPSGYLHIGHVKAILLNYQVAKNSGGSMILRFDNTNPSRESVEFINAIKEDVYSLGIIPSKVSYTTDYIDKILFYGSMLVNKGLMYYDNSTREEIAQSRRSASDLDSEYKSNIEYHKTMWDKYVSGEIDNGVFRGNMDMASKNGALRDPVFFRHMKESHCVEYKYKVFPTYDFACPIVDYIEGVNYVMRSIQFLDRDEQYKLILKYLDLPDVPIYSYNLLSVSDKDRKVILGKRHIADAIKSGKVLGWEDWKLLTLRGLRNRGIRSETLEKFVLETGQNHSNGTESVEKLLAINRVDIDILSARIFGIMSSDVIVYNVLNCDNMVVSDLLYQKNKDLGSRDLVIHGSTVMLSHSDLEDVPDNSEITLLRYYNFTIDKINHTITYLPNRNYKHSKYKLCWLSNPLSINTVSFKSNTLFVTPYYIESCIDNIGTKYIQIYRNNYYYYNGNELINVESSFLTC